MVRNMRKSHDAAFKASVALEALKGEKTMAQISSEYGVHVNQIRQWRQKLLDELPQVFNVLQGEMSLVGPRPTLAYQVAAYDDFQRRRLLVKPGITGWAQVNGRNAIPWEERIKLDVWYVDHWSLRLDLSIMRRTLKTWVRKEGLYGPAGVNYDFAAPS